MTKGQLSSFSLPFFLHLIPCHTSTTWTLSTQQQTEAATASVAHLFQNMRGDQMYTGTGRAPCHPANYFFSFSILSSFCLHFITCAALRCERVIRSARFLRCFFSFSFLTATHLEKAYVRFTIGAQARDAASAKLRGGSIRRARMLSLKGCSSASAISGEVCVG